MSLEIKINSSFLLCIFLTIFEGEGLNSSLLDGKIIGGYPATQQDVKFMASLKKNSIHFCSGCVISPKHILTAGQCIYFINFDGKKNYANVTVWLGTIELYGYGIKRNVKDLEHHPQFNPLTPSETCAYDIGVILLDKDIVETDLIGEISYSYMTVVPNMKIELIGWGPESVSKPYCPSYPMTEPHILKKMYLKIMGQHPCQNNYYKLKYDKKRHFCAEGQTENTTYQGDIGSPLVRYNKIVGITIQTPILGRGRLASLFIKVSMFDVYIEDAKFRLIENQNSDSNKRSNEECLEPSSKRKKDELIRFL